MAVAALTSYCLNETTAAILPMTVDTNGLNAKLIRNQLDDTTNSGLAFKGNIMVYLHNAQGLLPQAKNLVKTTHMDRMELYTALKSDKEDLFYGVTMKLKDLMVREQTLKKKLKTTLVILERDINDNAVDATGKRKRVCIASYGMLRMASTS